MKGAIPKHIAIIMDGNGRWAKSRKKPRIFGHREGANRVSEIVEECAHIGLSHLTLYAFSEENWRRPDREVSFLMDLLNFYLLKERKRLLKNNIKLLTIGNIDKLPQKTQALVNETVEVLSQCDGMTLTLALSYSGRNDLAQAAKSIAQLVKAGKLEPEDVTEETLSKHFFLPDLPDVDLLIRTSGEQRVSNFLLWHLSYAELYFSPKFWPEFTPAHLHRALASYRERDRRFGNVTHTGEHVLYRLSDRKPVFENNLC